MKYVYIGTFANLF